jgi:hypothetical protein
MLEDFICKFKILLCYFSFFYIRIDSCLKPIKFVGTC